MREIHNQQFLHLFHPSGKFCENKNDSILIGEFTSVHFREAHIILLRVGLLLAFYIDL